MSACMDNLVALIDDDLCIGCEAVAAESDYSRLANECHRLRLENDRMKAALKIIDGTLDVVRGENDA
jgi:hypothetical protein